MLGRDVDEDILRGARPVRREIPRMLVSTVWFVDVVIPPSGEPWPEPPEVEIVLPPTPVNALALMLFDATDSQVGDC